MHPVAVDRPRVTVPSPDSTAPPKPVEDRVQRIAPPELAHAHGWMALSSTGADAFVAAHPEFDGRGVLIAILDAGVDPSIPGLAKTSTGDAKLLDVRDFSGEGAVPLARISPEGDSVSVGGRTLRGFGRVRALNTDGPWYAGAIAELPLGEPPASDLNGNGTVGDSLVLVVTRATDGWVVLADTDGDGSLANERPVHDYLVSREWFGWSPRGKTPPLAMAANFGESAGRPTLDLVFELYAHGSHVAGIAAAHDLYGVAGFDGVAPGAQLLGLKIASGAQGGISTTGAMLRAMDYAIRFAESRRLRLVLNLSFGVGNEIEGSARIDRLVDSVLQRHPSVVMTISAGNDGPGLSTLGFPGSSERAVTVGATFPSVFLAPTPGGGTAPERVAYFSSRGGELAKPDVITPGVAYSGVPRWNAGDEVKQGTSMAAPHAAGLAALLLSAAARDTVAVPAARIRRALMVTARAEPEAGFVDEGRGIPDVEAALRWLQSGRSEPDVAVRVPGTTATAAWIERRPGAAADSVVRFQLTRGDTPGSGTYTLRSDVPWLRPPPRVSMTGRTADVELSYSAAKLARPGAYTGTVTGWTGDTLAGPAFRLVVTVVNPVASGDSLLLRAPTTVGTGSVLRSFFLADTTRPFEVTVTTGASDQGIAFLHEPHGMPFRDGNAVPVGSDPATYPVDGRDVRSGMYEVDVTPIGAKDLRATILVRQAPFTIGATREGDAVVARLTGVGGKADTQVRVGLIGGERMEKVATRGSDPVRVPFVLPSWATAVVVDVAMDRAQWGRFTDFGLTLFDSNGRQLGKDPLEYSFGRLSVDVARGQADRPVAVTLFPGFADPADTAPWSATVSVRLYADTMAAVPAAGGDTAAVVVSKGMKVTRRFAPVASPWKLGEGFAPLGVVIARTSGRIWTREAALDD
jgi:subtilisin family serine protease